MFFKNNFCNNKYTEELLHIFGNNTSQLYINNIYFSTLDLSTKNKTKS